MPKASKGRPKKQRKRATNLSLDSDAVRRGERFGARHGTSLSQLVTSFLHALPAEGETVPALSPPVRRLYGLVAGGATDRDAWHRHLSSKYGKR